MPRISAARITFVRASYTISWLIAGAISTWPSEPSGALKRFSGDDAGPGHQLARAGVRGHVVEVELGRLLQHRPGALAQKFAVAGEGVMLPCMLRQPPRSALPQADAAGALEGRLPPRVGRVMHYEPFTAVGDLRRAAAPGRAACR